MSSEIVETGAGKVVGASASGVSAFKGIPYGASPSGQARFRPPTPPVPWTGTRTCTTFGPTAPQAVLDFSAVMPPEFQQLRETGKAEQPAVGEDCLVLNVWTPVPDGARRPVMVWLHGGPFTTGSGSPYDGTNLARGGDVVVVTVNHRLGVLGHLHLDQLAPDRYTSSGMVGMLDLVAALEWVRDNIAAFGGDPSNVTIFGCSGGGMKASTLLAMPSAHGLFHRAIIESGPYLRGVEAARATEIAERVLHELGLTASQVDRLHGLPLEQLLDAQGTVLGNIEREVVGASDVDGGGKKSFAVRVARGGTLWDLGPTVDGVALPTHPFDPVAPSWAADVPLIIGNNKNESSTWLLLMGDVPLEEVGELAVAIRGDRGKDLMALYERALPDATPGDVLDALISTDAMWLDGVHLAERKAAGGPAPVFMYQFAYESDVLDGRLKAAHGMEVSFVFDDVDSSPMAGTRPERFEVARTMSDAWVAFAREGDPNHAGIPKWSTYTPGDRSTMVFDAPCRLAADPTELREGLDRLGVHFAR